MGLLLHLVIAAAYAAAAVALAVIGFHFSLDRVDSLDLDSAELVRRGFRYIKIEAEQTLLELLDFSVAFGQGYLFGEPRISRQAA